MPYIALRHPLLLRRDTKYLSLFFNARSAICHTDCSSIAHQWTSRVHLSEQINMLSFNLNVLTILATVPTLINAFTISHWAGKECRSQSLGKGDFDPTSGCQRGFAGNSASVVIQPAPDDKDFGNVVVFFSGDDCKPSDIMNNGEGFSDDGCFTGNYGSYEVWDLWKI